MSCKGSSCGTVPSKRKVSGFWSWVPAALVAILPKCPFCIMAYSGAIPLCSGSAIYPNEGTLPMILTLVFAVIVLMGILLNPKGRKTLIAVSIAVSGILVLALSQTVYPSMAVYYTGVAVLFFGIWYNGSFSYFKRRAQHILLSFSPKTNVNDDSRKI